MQVLGLLGTVKEQVATNWRLPMVDFYKWAYVFQVSRSRCLGNDSAKVQENGKKHSECPQVKTLVISAGADPQA